MKGNDAKMAPEEVERRMRELCAQNAGRKSLGFFIQIMFAIGTAGTIVFCGAWKVLWALLGYFPMLAVFFFAKNFFWNWTENRLRADAEAGMLRRAVWWDYLSVAIDWAICTANLAAMAYLVFFLTNGYGLSRPLVWLCIAGTHTLPSAFMQKEPGYNWGNFMFWQQWALVAILFASSKIPVGPGTGMAIQAAVGLVSIPLACTWKRRGIVDKVSRYNDNFRISRAFNVPPAPSVPVSDSVELLKAAWSNMKVRWIPFSATMAIFAAGVAWTLACGRALPLAFAVLAFVLGYAMQALLAGHFDMTSEDIAKRGLDTDLTRGFADSKALVLSVSLFLASAAVLWLGGRDVRLLAALSLLATGSCLLSAYASYAPSEGREAEVDWLYIPLFLAAFCAVCSLRVAGFRWWACALPIPAMAYLVPAFRWFFPRSGLRGDARKAAIADMSRRLELDVRSESEKTRDDKMEKRRLRNERRMANFRRSRR